MDFSRFMKPQDLEGIELEHSPIGLTIHYTVLCFNDSFNDSGKEFFTNFINEFGKVKKWIISSDYAFYDKDKKNDVVTFSIFLHLAHFNKMSDYINAIAPADIKKVKSVSDEFITFLSSGPVFNISFILDRERRMHSDERSYHLHRLESMIRLLEYWCKSTPEGKENYQKRILELNKAKDLINSPGVNLRIFRDIEIVAQLAAFLLAEISMAADVEIISWLSDRDSMLTFKNKIIGDYMLEQVASTYHVLCGNNGVDSSEKLLLPKPELEGDNFYDSFIRIPDYISGTLADFDFEKNKSSRPKFEKVKNGTFSEESRNIIYQLFFHPNFRAYRIPWEVESDGDIKEID